MDAKSLLVVDDDEVYVYLVQRSLRNVDAISSIETATNGDEALKLIEHQLGEGQSPADLILLDINMPVKDGFEFLDGYNALCEQYRDTLDSTVVVMLTSSHNENDRARAAAFGVVGSYITKPDSTKELVDAISTLV
ncbi:MAG: response regulator [Planctomycetota bacterium]